MVIDFAIGFIHGKHMVVLHVEMVTQVVFRYAGIDIMGWIDIDPPLKDMCRRVCCINVFYEMSCFFHMYHFQDPE